MRLAKQFLLLAETVEAAVMRMGCLCKIQDVQLQHRYERADSTMRKKCRFVCCVLLLTGPAAFFAAAQTQSNPQNVSPPVAKAPEPAQSVPVMDGGAGPCSIEFTATSAEGKPVYGASVKVHIAYGFGGFHRLDLEAGTNSEGKVKFTGLPARVRRPPLEFQASKDRLVGSTTYDPSQECQAKRSLVLDNPKPAPSN
jgi:hypothetical protein